MLSIIIPTLNEAATLPALLTDLRLLDAPHEVIVADGSSEDETQRVAADFGAEVVLARRGRGSQLREGVGVAKGRVLCVLHADVRLNGDARTALARLASHCPDGVAHAFTLRIAGEGWRYRFVEWGTDRRARWAKLPYGDQGLMLTRATYDAVGGFPDVPLMEDVALVRAVRRAGGIQILPEHVTVSPRRWEQEGVLRRMVRNWALMAAYLAGVDVHRLAAAYPAHFVAPRPRGVARATLNADGPDSRG